MNWNELHGHAGTVYWTLHNDPKFVKRLLRMAIQRAIYLKHLEIEFMRHFGWTDGRINYRTQIIDYLEVNGYALRCANKHKGSKQDRRCFFVFVTSAGRRFAGKR